MSKDMAAMHEVKTDTALIAANGAGGYLVYNLTLSDWVAILTIVLLVLQIGLALPKYYALLFKKNINDRP